MLKNAVLSLCFFTTCFVYFRCNRPLRSVIFFCLYSLRIFFSELRKKQDTHALKYELFFSYVAQHNLKFLVFQC